MITDKTRQLKQDLGEVNGAIEDLESRLGGFFDSELKDLKDKIYIFNEHLKNHIEDVENFVGRIN